MHRWYDPATGRWISEDPIGFAAGDANLYRYVGNGVTYKSDPSGLWERSEFRHVLGRSGLAAWVGYAIAECDNESLYTLAYLMTGRWTAYNGEPAPKPIKKGDKVPVRKLLSINDTAFRKSVVATTSKFSAAGNRFPSPDEGFIDGDLALTAGDIDCFYVRGNKTPVDCLGAAHLVFGKGLSDALNPGEFDALYKLNSIPFESIPATSQEARPGDWGYIKNDARYLNYHPNGGYQGENVIKVGEDEYWGFPGGVKSEEGWQNALVDSFNNGLNGRTQPIAVIPGWQPHSNRFLDVAQITEDAFDLRKSTIAFGKE